MEAAISRIELEARAPVEPTAGAEPFAEARLPRGERTLLRLRQRDAFEVDGVKIRFSDGAWDLSPIVAKPRSTTSSKLAFADLGEFTDLVKLYCFELLTGTNLAVETIGSALASAAKFLRGVIEAGYYNVESVPYSHYAESYGQPRSTSYSVHVKDKRRVRAFLEFYEANFSVLPDRRCLKLLDRCDDSRLKAEQKANRRDAIEQGYLEELLYVCLQVSRDPEADLSGRIIACCLLIYSQIGCRTRELGTFKAGGLGKVEGGSRGDDMWFAEFKFSKRKGASRADWEPTTCYMNDIALEAFWTLESICRPQREKVGTDSLVVFPRGAVLDGTSFYEHYHKFVLNHLSSDPFLNNADRSKGMRALSAGEAVRLWLDRDSDEEYAQELDRRGLAEDDTIVYPEVRMFRNTVCTGLYRQKKSLTWIRRHLNHLCKEMEAYYNRADREIDEKFSNEIYCAVLTEGARLVGPNSDAFTQVIYDFLKKRKLLARIESDPEAVVRKLSKNLPLKKKHCGMCIRCAGFIPCAVDDLTDEIVCALGVCPNHCSTYWMAAGSYADAGEAALVVRANVERGRTKEARHELSKLRKMIDERLAPELAEIEAEIGKVGADVVVGRHSELEPIIENLEAIKEEVEKWREWTI